MAPPDRGREARMMAPVEPLTPESRLGDVYLTSEELRTRVRELGREVSRDYEGREPLLVAPLKASIVFVSDLSRALTIHHGLDFIELASYASGADQGGHARIRLLKDLDAEIAGRHVLIVEDVPVRYVGFTVPDELFVGYGFDLQERYRNLPDLHVLSRET